MRLCHPDWQYQIRCGDGNATILSIENPILMRKYIGDLLLQIEGEDGDFVLSEDNEEVPIYIKVAAITSPLSFSIEDKRIQSKLNSMLKSFAVSSDMYAETSEVLSSVVQYGNSIAEKFPLPIAFEEPDSDYLLKILGFVPEYDYESQLEKLVEYMNLMHSFCGFECFVLIGMCWFFTFDEIKLLIDNCRSLKHSLILVEGRLPDKILEDKTIEKVIIDIDGCEIFSEG